jgi:hypothetical protein
MGDQTTLYEQRVDAAWTGLDGIRKRLMIFMDRGLLG